MIDEFLRRRLQTEPGETVGGRGSSRACLNEMKLYLHHGVNTRYITQLDATLITLKVFVRAGLEMGTRERLKDCLDSIWNGE